MSNYINITLDTTAPSSPSIVIENGNANTSLALVDAAISVGDGTTTSYQMKIWGDIDISWGISNSVLAADSTTSLEADALWITYATSKQLQLSSPDGTKTIYLKVRDDVYNESSIVNDTITLNTSVPVVTISSGPDVSKISKVSGKNVASFSFTSDTDFVEYKVKVVPATGSIDTAGTLIDTTNGSTNMSATGDFLSSDAISCTINGADLEVASAGDGDKIIKVFVKNSLGSWSI